MQNLRNDVPRAIVQVLETHDFKKRRQLVTALFTEDAVFVHPFHIIKGREGIFGIYQMWGAFNFRIKVDFLRVVPDPKTNRVLVDLFEHISVWWTPFPWLGLDQKLYLHVIMDCVKDPKTGHFMFKRQEDHIFWLESMLYHTPWITLYIGPLIMEPYVKPALGNLLSSAGKVWQDRALKSSTKGAPRINRIRDPRADLAEAMRVAYSANSDDLSEMVNTCYSPNAMFAHPLFIVYGRPAIRGIWFFWARVMNRRIRGQVRAIVPSDNNDLVLADVVQQFIPRWWPFNIYFSLYVHAVLTLEQSTSGGGLQCCWQTCLSSMLRNAGVILIWVLISTTPGANFTQGFHIVKHEDHVLWLESLFLCNLGPVSWFLRERVRIWMGWYEVMLGHAIYTLAVWLDQQGILPKLSAQANQLADQALAFRAWLYHAIIEFCNWLLSLVGLAEQHTKDIRGQAQLQMQHATGQARQHAEGIAAQARETADQAAQCAKEVAAQAKQQAMDATNTH